MAKTRNASMIIFTLFGAATVVMIACSDGSTSPQYKVAAAEVKPPHVDDPPNLIIVSIDTLRRDHLAIYGYPRSTAPNVSLFANTAIVFDEMIAACVNTAPSHASILTGLYPLTHGITLNGRSLKKNVTTLGEILQSKGYQTSAFVSGWTLNGNKTKLNRGYEHYDDDFRYIRKAADTYQNAAQWLDKINHDKPTFLFFHLFDPHQPYLPPDDYIAQFLKPDEWRRAESASVYKSRLDSLRAIQPKPAEVREFIGRYDAEILYADHHVGKLFDALKSKHMFENSIIIVLSDHGETLDERPYVFAHGGRAYDEQIRIPLIVRFPHGRWGGGRRSTDAHHVDLVPTILDYLSLSMSSSVQGISLMDAVMHPQKKFPRRPMLSHARGEPRRLLEFGKDVKTRGLITALRQHPFKYITYPTLNGEIHELFDLEHDVGEETNLAQARKQDLLMISNKLRSLKVSMESNSPSVVPKMSGGDIKALKALGYME